MRIAQVSPLWESVPPKLYGGTERIVSYLTEELVRQGHEVTLFASGDSVTSAKLRAPCPQSLRLGRGVVHQNAPLILMIEQAFGSVGEFDLIHSHLDFLGFPLTRRGLTPVVTTLHGRLDLPELMAVYREFAELPLVSISDAQRRPVPIANWQATVYHGLPRDLYSFHPQPGKYLAYLGRMASEKCPEQAIELAKRVGLPLRIAAKVDPADREFFQQRVEPLLSDPLVEYLGEISDSEKDDFLGEAYALVCPYDWPEPFGLVFIEAFACGTPVLAYRRGSVPEIIEDGVTGFVCDSLNEMAASVARIEQIDRRRCRQVFDERFTAEQMARDYVRVYERVAAMAALEPARSHGRSRVRASGPEALIA